MNGMLQRHCAKYVYAIPDGLRELLTDISREVLRNEPVHTYTFIADYLDALLITRENARVAARLVESITEIGTTTVELLTSTGMSRDAANRVSSIIQNYFRKFLARKKSKLSETKAGDGDEEDVFVKTILADSDMEYEDLEQAAIIIQNAYRTFKQRQERQKDILFGMVDWRIAARSAIYLYRKTGVSPEEAKKAATLIKAAYKGYYTRRVMRKLLTDGLNETEIEASAEDGLPDEMFLQVDNNDEDMEEESSYAEKDAEITFSLGDLPWTAETGEMSTLIYSSEQEAPTDTDFQISSEKEIPPETDVEEVAELVQDIQDDLQVTNAIPDGVEQAPQESSDVNQVETVDVIVDGDQVAGDQIDVGIVVEDAPEKLSAEGEAPADNEVQDTSEPVTEIIIPAPSETPGSNVEADTDRSDVTATTEATETFVTTETEPPTTTDEETTEG